MFPIARFDNLDRSKLASAFPKIEKLYRDFAGKEHVPGVVYGVVVDGKLVFSGGIGVQNIETQTPVTPDSVYRIASMSKSFTAMALLRLRDAGRLHLDEPVVTYVPELASQLYPTRDSAPVTVRHLMTMSAGLPQDDPWADRHLDITPEQFSALMQAGVAFSAPPNTRYEYSNLGYGILGRVVTNVAGMPYQQYIRDNILLPLGMTSSTYDVKQVDSARLAMGYFRRDNQWIADPPIADGEFGSMGGLFTTINDFSRYMAFLLDAFPPRDDDETGPIRRSSAREMQQPWRQRLVAASRATPDAPALYQSEGYGFGLSCGVDSLLGYSVAHGGGLPGYGTFYRLLPERGIGLVAFSNLTYTSPASVMTPAFSLLFKTGGAPRRVIPPSAALLAAQDTITRLYEQWDDDLLTGAATDSFFMYQPVFKDEPLEQRREQFAALRKNFGKCLSVTPIEPEDALRGRWTLRCRNGRIGVFVTMASYAPPKIQYMQLTLIKPLGSALRQTIDRLVALMRAWDDAKAATLFSRAAKPSAMRAQFEALRVQYGSLRAGDTLEGDGRTQAVVQLVGQRGSVNMKVVVSRRTGRITSLTFTRPRETAFVP
ncbi:MAG: beta-lactamase family protein [Anaerolineae bacterium]|nr:beta-lactamase family protein [Anaerolineae bacterium]